MAPVVTWTQSVTGKISAKEFERCMNKMTITLLVHNASLIHALGKFPAPSIRRVPHAKKTGCFGTLTGRCWVCRMTIGFLALALTLSAPQECEAVESVVALELIPSEWIS